MSQSIKIFVFSTASLAAGIVIGYKVAEQRLAEEFEERMQKEEELVKEFYSHPARKKYSSPEEAVADLIKDPPNGTDPREPIQKVAYHKVEKPTEDDDEGAKAAAEAGQVLTRNVFETAPDPEKPYVISQEEFMQNDPSFEQATLTYYEKDNTLADERDDIVSDRKNTVGTEFQDRFGEGSSDNNVVHIRNEKVSMDFEVIRSERSFSADVLGEPEAG
jgi:hypothetical protein